MPSNCFIFKEIFRSKRKLGGSFFVWLFVFVWLGFLFVLGGRVLISFFTSVRPS